MTKTKHDKNQCFPLGFCLTAFTLYQQAFRKMELWTSIVNLKEKSQTSVHCVPSAQQVKQG